VSEQQQTALPRGGYRHRLQVAIALLGLWVAAVMPLIACVGANVVAGGFSMWRSFGAVQPSAVQQTAPTRLPTPTISAAVATARAASGGFVAPVPLFQATTVPASEGAPSEGQQAPLPPLPAATVEPAAPGVGEGPTIAVAPTLAPRPPAVQTATAAARPAARVYRVKPNDDGYVSVRSTPNADPNNANEVTRLQPGTRIACERLETGEFLFGTDQWAYCPESGGYVLSSLLEPVR
jgi:hypothetical protein